MNGGCCCGDVRYELRADLRGVYYCHCRDCQLHSGGAFHVLGIVDRDALIVVSGQTTAYRKPADSGFTMTREFCATCGTPLFLDSDRFEEITMFAVSSLDEPQAVQPAFQIWTSSKLPWSEIGADLESFARGALDGAQ